HDINRAHALTSIDREDASTHPCAAVRCLGETAQRFDDAGLGLVEEVIIIDAGEVQDALFALGLHAGQEARGLSLTDELLASAMELCGDCIFDSKERAELACQAALIDHFCEEIAQQRRIEPGGKVINKCSVSGH